MVEVRFSFFFSPEEKNQAGAEAVDKEEGVADRRGSLIKEGCDV